MSEKFYIYGSMADHEDRTECISKAAVLGKFKEVLHVYERRGCSVSEEPGHKWKIRDPHGKEDTLWIENEAGQILEATGI